MIRLLPGDVIEGKYRIVRLLGEGGMGAVYEGENIRIRHRVAIKVLHAAIATEPQIVERFELEAQAAGAIGSEHIVEVLDLGALPNGARFMVMEFLDGENLAKRLETLGRMSPAELIPKILQLLDGLAAAHEAGIVHRDLKPENVFLLRRRGGTRDFVKILDFGISKFSQAVDGKVSATSTGAVMGTPTYMSPEQASGGRDVDSRTDLYAVGVILYECLTGAPPFTGETLNEILFKVVLEKPKGLADAVPLLDPALVAIVEKAMAREREDRYQTAAEFQQALVDCAEAAGLSLALAPAGTISGRASLLGGASKPSIPVQDLAPAVRPGTVGSWATSGPVRNLAPGIADARRLRWPPLALAGSLAVVLLGGAGLFLGLRARSSATPTELGPPRVPDRAPASGTASPSEAIPAPRVVPPPANSIASAAPATSNAPRAVAKNRPAPKRLPPSPTRTDGSSKPPKPGVRKIHTEL